jgi:hypothetical protein
VKSKASLRLAFSFLVCRFKLLAKNGFFEKNFKQAIDLGSVPA